MERNVETELLRLGWTMEQDVVADYDDEEEEVVMYEDVEDMTMIEEELEPIPIFQVGPGSYML